MINVSLNEKEEREKKDKERKREERIKTNDILTPHNNNIIFLLHIEVSNQYINRYQNIVTYYSYTYTWLILELDLKFNY